VLSPAFTSRLLPAALGVLILCAVAVPARYMGWARPIGQLVTGFAAPISHPFAAFSRWILPADTTASDNERVRELEARLEEAERELRRVQQENKRLVQSLEELNVLAIVNTSPVRQVFAPIFASSSDLSSNILRARAGRDDGVDVSSVATAAGMQLLGRVVSVEDRTCDIRVFTAKGNEPLNCMIMIDATANGLACRLTPIGDGTLKGPVEDRRDPTNAQAIEPAVGQVVRLSDGRWPTSSQMLLIGKVTKVEPSPDGPLRKLVTVTPSIERLERVSEVVIRTNAAGSDSKSGGQP
jgi:cell shape-determining protein MreC